MNISPEMTCRDLYVRHTSPEGSSYIVEHRVWDADKFLAALQSACRKVNAEAAAEAQRKAGFGGAILPLTLAKVELVDRAAYVRERTDRSRS